MIACVRSKLVMFLLGYRWAYFWDITGHINWRRELGSYQNIMPVTRNEIHGTNLELHGIMGENIASISLYNTSVSSSFNPLFFHLFINLLSIFPSSSFLYSISHSIPSPTILPPSLPTPSKSPTPHQQSPANSQ